MLAQIKIQSLSNDTHSELDSDSSALDNNFMMGTGCKGGGKKPKWLSPFIEPVQNSAQTAYCLPWI